MVSKTLILLAVFAGHSALVSSIPPPPHNFTGLWNPENGDPSIAWTNPGPPPSDDATWNAARCKGNKLLRMMAADDATAGSMLTPPLPSAQSRFRDFTVEFPKWGYINNREIYCDMDQQQYGMEPALQAIGASTSSSAWKCFTAWHGDPYGRTDIGQQTYQVNGRTYRMTRARFSTAVNPTDGIILMTSRYSPEVAGREVNPPVLSGFPELKRASDVVWGQWTLWARSRTANIRFVGAWSVVNPTSASIIRRALQLAGRNQLDYYPGVSFSMDSEAGQALLGSPNGSAVGFLLSQHKEQLGNKRVTAVTIFGHKGQGALPFEPVMLFYVS